MESIKELSAKLAKSRLKNAGLVKKNKLLVGRNKELELSRAKWKSKFKRISLGVRPVGQDSLDLKDCYGLKASRHLYSIKVMHLCLNLRLVAGCSYRSIRKIIGLFELGFLLEMSRIPCANTVENWVKKLGYYELVKRQGSDLGECIGLIVDESMRVGPYKQLLILGVNAAKTDSNALDYSKVRVLHMSISKSYKGEQISAIIADVGRQTGKKIVYGLSDDDSKLKKAFRLNGTVRISDVSHAMGRCLEKTFKQDTRYQAFSKAVSHWQCTGVNRTYAYLLPPKQRVMARFMNLTPVVVWGKEMLRGFEHLTKEEQEAFSGLKHYEGVLQELHQALQLAQTVAVYLKKEGLSVLNIEKCMKTLEQECKVSCPSLDIFKELLINYLMQINELVKGTTDCWQCSSEVIESVFGKRKSRDADNHLVQNGVNVLEIPLYCLNQTDLLLRIRPAMESISQHKIQEWIALQFPLNQSFKRNKFFKNERKIHQH